MLRFYFFIVVLANFQFFVNVLESMIRYPAALQQLMIEKLSRGSLQVCRQLEAFSLSL